jgi:hypothetical protein
VVAVVGSLATIFKFQDVPCLIRFDCPIDQKKVELVVQSDTGELLSGVEVRVLGRGAPEIQTTDSNGYIEVMIASKGNVRVNLSKSGYPVQDFNINLENDQKTVRVIRLAKSGQPEVISSSTIPPVVLPSPEIEAKVIKWSESGSDLAGKVDQDFTFMCEPNGTVGSVWGTDFYTLGSSICSAAVHAGIINARDGGKIRIRVRAGEKFYNGTTRHGVTSLRYGSYEGSFTFLNSAGSPIISEQIQNLNWDETAFRLQGKLDQDFTYNCESNGTVGSVWGTDLYSLGSSICSAAVHAGIINAKEGGKVQIRIRPGQDFYNGTSRNGVKSIRYSRDAWSFQFVK